MKTCYSKVVNTHRHTSFEFKEKKGLKSLNVVYYIFFFCNQQLPSLEHTVANSNHD